MLRHEEKMCILYNIYCEHIFAKISLVLCGHFFNGLSDHPIQVTSLHNHETDSKMTYDDLYKVSDLSGRPGKTKVEFKVYLSVNPSAPLLAVSNWALPTGHICWSTV